MLLAVVNNPGLLQKAGLRIHKIADLIKGLLGDSEGTILLKKNPRLFVASAAYIERNYATLSCVFDQEHVSYGVCARSGLRAMTGSWPRKQSKLMNWVLHVLFEFISLAWRSNQSNALLDSWPRDWG